MLEVAMSGVVLAMFAMIVAVLVKSQPPTMRTLVWLGFVEYLAAAGAQLIYTRLIYADGGDSVHYGETGHALATVLSDHFDWGGPEIIAMLFQRPSDFDDLVIGGGGSNTGSMYAISTIILYVLQGSEYAAHFFVSCLSFIGTFNLYNAFRDLRPEERPQRIFIASVMIPSVAFWTCAIHKESFCIIGLGAMFASWRAWRHGGVFRATVYGLVGVTLVFLFRAPAFAPLGLGLAMYFVVKKIQSARGYDSAAAPVYVVVAAVGLVGAMVLLGKYAPTLAAENVTETVTAKQQAWSTVSGGSSFTTGDEAPTSLAGQLVMLPLALLNALFRPQLFDVHNAAILLSATEMTIVTWIVVRAFSRHRFIGVWTYVRSSPFLALCAATSIVGCALVGLLTRNFGSLVRYRSPFLPFYGALLMSLAYHVPRKLTPTRTAARALLEQRRLLPARTRTRDTLES